MIYIILFFLVFSPFLFDKLKYTQNRSSYGHSKYYFIIVAIFMILLLSLRHDYFGTDTQNYRTTYETFKNLSFDLALEYNNDIGFAFVFHRLSNMGVPFRFVLLLQSILYVSSITILIRNNSKIPAISYWLFITFGFFVFATTLRQSIALSFTLLAYEQVKKKKLFKYLILIFIATTFHLSALIFLPVYWINKFKFNKFTVGLITFATLSIFVFKDKIGEFILQYNPNQYVITDTGGYFQVLLVVTLILIGLFYHKKFLKFNEVNRVLFYFMAITLALTPISKLNPALFRISQYFWIFMIIYIPNLIAKINDILAKYIITYGFIFIGIFNFYYKISSYGIRMHPYVFFWQEYPIHIPGLN